MTLAVALGAFVALAAAGWPGARIDCRTEACFCELERPGWLRQPVNTLSNLVPVALAFVATPGLATSRTRAGAWFRAVFPAALGFQGTGSMFFHASLARWAGTLDALSMLLMMALFVAANRVRWARKEASAAQLLVPWLALASLAASVAVLADPAVPAVMFALLVTNLALEAAISRRGPCEERWLRLGLIVFVLANVAWSFSVVPGQLLCAPSSWLQGHAVWHVGAAIAVSAFGRHVARALG